MHAETRAGGRFPHKAAGSLELEYRSRALRFRSSVARFGQFRDDACVKASKFTMRLILRGFGGTSSASSFACGGSNSCTPALDQPSISAPPSGGRTMATERFFSKYSAQRRLASLRKWKLVVSDLDAAIDTSLSTARTTITCGTSRKELHSPSTSMISLVRNYPDHQ